MGIPPGWTVAELMQKRGLTPDELATNLELTLEEFQQLLSGKLPIDQTLASKLEQALGAPAGFWLALQHSYNTASERITG